ncbi:MAG: M23 family metallopeptidase [Pseudomonadota bacterium]
MTASAVFFRRAALAGCALLVVAAALKFGSGLETSTEVLPPAIHQQAQPVVQAPQPAPAMVDVVQNVAPASVPPADDDVALLRSRALTLPVQGIAASQLGDTYSQARAAGTPHEAIDIMAARGTPVLAVEDGLVAKLFLSKPGGITIYQFDPASQYAYYYAHLDRYADGVAEGAALRKGQVIGYVGSTGNASPDAPHLHFAIFKLGPERQWWRGTPLNPYLVWRDPKP